MWRSWPVVWLDRSERRKATVWAISSAVVMRWPRGMRASIWARAAAGLDCVESHVSYIGVQHSATMTELTRMLYLASSTAHSRVRALRPPLAAAYAEVPPWPVSATLEPMLTMAPRDFFN